MDIPAQPLGDALRYLGQMTGRQLVFSPEAVKGVRTRALHGQLFPFEALLRLLRGTGLNAELTPFGAFIIRQNVRLVRSPQIAADRRTTARRPPVPAEPPLIGDIIVNAEKRIADISDVPMAVSSVTEQMLFRAHATGLADYARSIAAVSLYENGAGFKQIIIRGISTGYGNSPTTTVYVDDVPITGTTSTAFADAVMPDIDPGDLSRIEVLKGPQGTLYGASSEGGVFKYITKAPDNRTPTARVAGSMSSIDHGGVGYQLRASINLPLAIDHLALRISGVQRTDAGYINNIITGQQGINNSTVTGSHLTILWQPGSEISVSGNVIYQARRSRGSSREDYDIVENKPIYGDLLQSRLPDIEYDLQHLNVYSVNATWKFQGGTLNSTTSFTRNNYTNGSDATLGLGTIFGELLGLPRLGTQSVNRYDNTKLTEELRLSASSAQAQWLAGVYVTRENARSYQFFAPIDGATGREIPGLPLLADSLSASRYAEVAGFTDGTWSPGSRFSINAGTRLSYDRRTDSEATSNSLLAKENSSVVHASEPVLTFVLAPKFRPSDDATLYGRFATGYRTGGTNPSITGIMTSYRSDRVLNYETGLKTYLLDRKVYADLSAFWIVWQNVQLISRTPSSEIAITNSGGASSRGIEFNVQAEPVTGWHLGLNYTYDRAALDNTSRMIAARRGDALPYTPRSAGTLRLDYGRVLSSRWNVHAGASSTFQGSRQNEFQDTSATPRVRFPAFDRTDIEIGASNRQVELSLFINNLFDERGQTSANTLTLDALRYYTIAVTQPRTIGCSVTRIW